MRVAKVTEQEWRTIQKGRRRKIHRYLRCQKFSRLNREFFQRFKVWGRPAVQRLLGGLCVVGGLAVYCMMHGRPDCGEIMFSVVAVLAVGVYVLCTRKELFV